MPGNDAEKKTQSSEGILAPSEPAEIAFVKGLVARGEAVKVTPGVAPEPNVTHEIVGETPSGIPIVKRLRFSAY
jgi:hypothetical protein